MTRRARTVRTRVTRLALVGLFALASHAFLPYLHGGTEARASHSADCRVCSALAHSGARAASAPSAPVVTDAPLGPAAAVLVTLLSPPSLELVEAPARAPPAALPIA